MVNGQTRLFAAWQERARVDRNALPTTPAFGFPYSDGSPRVMFTMSSDGGWSWTARRAIDAGVRNEHPLLPGIAEPAVPRPSAPQLQPVLSVSGVTNPQLVLMYYEARDELAAPFGSNFISGIERQMDVRSARINPATGQLLAPSVQVAQYNIKANSSPVELTETAPGYDAVSRPNLWMYGGGTKGFFGDYLHVAPSTVFEFDTGNKWKYASDPASSLAIWTDHRDVQFPAGNINGAWSNYTPLNASSLASCSFVAMRNANPYFTEIAGVVAGSPQNFKRLNIQRAFVTYVENRTAQDRRFRLTLSGTPASFDQFASAGVMDVQVFAHSSHTQTVWVAPNTARPTASAKMAVVEIDAGGATVPGGYRTSVTLNPDPNNDALTPIPTAVPVPAGTSDSINTTELHNPQVSAPQVSAFNITAPQVSAPQVSAPQVSAPQVSAPQVSAPQVSAPQVSAPQVSASTPGDGNEGTDVTYTVTNPGNTESTYTAFLSVPEVQQMLDGEYYDFQLLITRTSLVPGFMQTVNGCVPAAETKVQVIANLQIPTTAATQFQTVAGLPTELATFSVGPEGGAAILTNTDAQSIVARDEVKVTLRAIRLQPLSAIPANLVFEPAEVVLTVASTSTNVLNGVVQADGTQPTATATSLPDLLIANYTPASPGLSAPPGGQVTFSSGTLRNQGASTQLDDTSIRIGYYLSTDLVFDGEGDPFLGQTTHGDLPAGGEDNFDGPTFTIPAATAAGSYYVLIRVDRSNAVAESDETNNLIVEPLVVTPTPIAYSFTGTVNAVDDTACDGCLSSTFNTSMTLSGLFAYNGNTPGTLNGTEANGFSNYNNALTAFVMKVGGYTASPPFTAPDVIDLQVANAFAIDRFIVANRLTGANFNGQPPLGFVALEDTSQTAFSDTQLTNVGDLTDWVVPGLIPPPGHSAEWYLAFSSSGVPPSISGTITSVSGIREWSTDAGGNGHYYEYVKQGGLTWAQAQAAASQRTFNGRTGHLVSITSAAENSFVNALKAGGEMRAWIGLRDPDGDTPDGASWGWTTGEVAIYSNWSTGEPNNPTFEFWVEMFTNGSWNNNQQLDPIYPTLGYIVEYPPVIP